jgi:hypothetical protein
MASSLFLPSLSLRPSRELLLLADLAALFICPLVLAHGAENPTLAIKVDQVGYPLDGPKVAFVSAPAQSFAIKRSSDGALVFHGNLAPAQADPNTGDQVQAADFSGFQKAGTYYIEVPGVGRSWNFAVGKNPFEHTYYLAMRGFYGQRCGTAVELGPEFPGFSHPACHTHGEFHPSSGAKGERDNIGGWHDAGDYGRYMVNSGITTGTLLWAWETYGQKLKSIQLKIPESGNGTPDILNEARWNLEWMLKMQDDDGGAWHKQTSEHFSAFVAPQDDTLPSEVIGTGSAPYKSTCATADLAAVAAIAARVYRPFDPNFAARALQAGRRAWGWTEKNPNVTFRNPPGVSTGEYGDSNCSDERLWAAAELGRTTGEPAFNDFFSGPPRSPIKRELTPKPSTPSASGPWPRRTRWSSARAPIPIASACRRRIMCGVQMASQRAMACICSSPTCSRPMRVSSMRRATICTICWGATPFRSPGSLRWARIPSSIRITAPAGQSRARPGRDCFPEGPMRAARTRCWQRYPGIYRRRRSMPISWPPMQAMRFASTGRRRWCFCWPENCIKEPRKI